MRPLSSDLREFIHLLNTNSVRFVIVGAWALAFHGRPRYTVDLDIFVARDDENADKLDGRHRSLRTWTYRHQAHRFLAGRSRHSARAQAQPH
jgi:hypothetical protein